MRRDRRLTFLTKERDGYINVLKSYQLDSTVDQQIKELQAEVSIIIFETCTMGSCLIRTTQELGPGYGLYVICMFL